MASSFESGALLGHVYTLADGSCVRLRLSRASDFTAVCGLLAEAGFDAPALAARRLVQFDPRWRYVVCATALVSGRATLLGIGSIRLGGQAPDLVAVDDAAPQDLRGLLETVLVDAARASERAA